MRVLEWLKASRAPFFLDVILCVCLGAAAAWHEAGTFDPWILAACLAGVMLLNAGTNLANDYYDHLSGADEANPSPTPFSGGSRAIQDGVFSAKQIRNAAFLCFALSVVAVALLIWRMSGIAPQGAGPLYPWPVLAFGVVGALSGLFYTAPPLKLGYRGFGELLAGLNVGPVAILGSYYAQAGTLSWGVAIVSLPLGCLSSALLVINQLPDVEPDRAVGKRHLVTRFGISFGVWGYLVLVLAAYVSAGAGIALGLVPRTAAIVFLAAPGGLWAFARARSCLSKETAEVGSPGRIVPALGANVAALLGTGALLCAGYLVDGMLS
ncbi:MAG: 1,4-dihydroxy-2-naphthoate octaprenyltransferase [Planctomycetota bacterium]